MLAGFVATPFILHWLGPIRFGGARVLGEWFAYVPLFELGISGSLAAHFAPSLGRGDHAAVRKLLAAGVRVYLYLAPLLFLAGFGLSVWLPRLSSFGSVGANEVRAAILILLIPGLWAPLTVYRVLAESRQRLYIVNALLMVQGLTTTALMAVAAWRGWGLPGQSMAAVVSQAPPVAILCWLGRRAYPGAMGEVPEREIMRGLWSLNWPTLAFNVSGRVGLLSDNIVIALMLGPSAVVPFYLTQRLVNVALTQLQGIGGASWAGLVELHSQNQVSKLHRRMAELTGLTSGLSIAVLGPIAAFCHPFTQRWVGANSYAGDSVAILASANTWLLCLASLWCWLISGTGHIRTWVPYALLFTTINLAASVAGTRLFGLAGPLFGTSVAFLTVYVWALPKVLRDLFGFEPRRLWVAAIRPLAWGIPYSALLYWLVRSHEIQSWWMLLAEMGIAILIGVALWWSMTLDAGSRGEWRLRIRGAVQLA